MSDSPPASVQAAAEAAFAYLSGTDPLPATTADAVLGFGVFDLVLPLYCGRLFRSHHARHVIFTGGIGAGTADLGGPEAEVWGRELLRADPAFPTASLLLENRSTNTTENIQFTAEQLKRERPDLAFGVGIHSVLVVASPSRLKRVQLALRLWLPDLRVTRTLPPSSYLREQALYASKGHDYLAHLTGELDRLVSYPARRWIADEPLPAAVAEAHAVLRARFSR